MTNLLQNVSVTGRCFSLFLDKSSSSNCFNLPTDPGMDSNLESVMDNFLKLWRPHSYKDKQRVSTISVLDTGFMV